MNPLDEMIKILNRAKNCQLALSILHQCKDNIVFKQHNILDETTRKKYLDHVHSLIEEAIKIIENR